MHRVLIVDDENLIREGLSRIIDWEAEGFSICGLAKDSRDAELAFETLQPDLLLTDIRMPGPDGLSLVESLRTRAPGLRVLVLTGHAEFEYARRALRSQVDGYLLKPVDEDELLAHVREIRTKLEKGRRQTPAASAFLESLIECTDADPAMIHEQALALGVNWCPCQILLAEARPARSATHGLGPEDLLCFHERVQGLCGELKLGLPFAMRGRTGILLSSTWTTVQGYAQLQRDFVRTLDMAHVQAVLAISPVVENLAQVAMAAQLASKAFERGFFASGDAIRVGRMPPEPGQSLPEISDQAAQLSYLLDVRNAGGVGRALEDTARELEASGIDETEFKARFAGLASLVCERWYSLHPADSSQAGTLAGMVAEIQRQTSMEALVADLAIRLQSLWYAAEPPAPMLLVERMEEMISLRYADALHLDDLARAFGYNSAYLGKLFKTRTGQSFNARLEARRMERARELVREGHKIHQVARMVGYQDPEYFMERFKKVVGMTPSAWKHSGES